MCWAALSLGLETKQQMQGMRPEPSRLLPSAWAESAGPGFAPTNMYRCTRTPPLSPSWILVLSRGNAGFCCRCQGSAGSFPCCNVLYDDSHYSAEKPCYSLEIFVVRRNFTDWGTGFKPFKADRTFPSGRTNFSPL